ncbi:MAG TPA: type II toxin-antitoxin system VapC family toxin [Gammaproteobacteria bacterium]|nr:type II toxin-antitoxin system VapC family toxin [Gammaproteobacteria bacterium]
MFAVDTNTLIYFFKGMGRVAERMLEVSPRRIGIPMVVVYEIESGIRKSDAPARRQRQFGELLDTVSILPFDHDAAMSAAELRAFLEARGTPIGPLDTLIAGTALASNATLVTHNTREFNRIPELTLDDWYI